MEELETSWYQISVLGVLKLELAVRHTLLFVNKTPYLYQSFLCQFLVDLWSVHDILSTMSIV